MFTAARSVRFGPFRWDALNRLLLREGTEIPLPPRVLAVLECLVERPGQVISRQELTERVWRDAYVTDTSLAEAISFLRQALGDDAQAPQYIQTIHRRGYRFVAAVEPESTAAEAATSPGAREVVKPSIGGALVPWSLVLLLGSTLVVAIWKLTHPPVAGLPRVIRFELSPPEGAVFRRESNNLAVSPDGRLIAFAACRDADCRLFVRDERDLSPRALEDTVDAAAPFFSPDGRSIGFFAEGKLKRISVAGGSPVVLADAPEALGGTWLRDGRILFSGHDAGGLEAVGENGGVPAPMTRVDAQRGEIGHRAPNWIAGSNYVIFTATAAPADRQADRAMALSLSTGQTRVLTGRASAARLLSSNLLMFGRGAELQAARFDSVRGVLASVAITVVRDLRSGLDDWPLFAASNEGTLLHVAGRSGATQFDLATASGIRPVAAALARLRAPALDGAGQRIAGVVSDGLRGDLWIGDTTRGTMTRLTNEHTTAAPVWSPDGRQIVFSAAAEGPFNLWIADPAGPSSRRLQVSGSHQLASDMTQGGDIVFTQIDPSTRGDVWLRTAEGRLRPLVQTAFDERDGIISPDGRWLAYRSDESGRWQVYVKALQGSTRAVVSEAGAGRPWWVSEDRLLYATATGSLAELRMTHDGPAVPGTPRVGFNGSIVSVARTGAVLISRYPAPLPPAVVTIEAWQDIWRALPPALTNLPR